MSKPRTTASSRRLEKTLSTILVGIGLFFAISCLTSALMHSPHNDELSTVEKSFQPSLSYLINYLQRDVHPPGYYVLAMLAGSAFGETLDTLRLMSWIFYFTGCCAIALNAWIYCNKSIFYAATGFALACASPIACNYAAFAKSYSLLYVLIPITLLSRRKLLVSNKSPNPIPSIAYVASLSLLGLTHFYGFALALSIALCDYLAKSKSTFKLNLLSLLAPTAWCLSSLNFLVGNGGRETFNNTSLDLLKDIAESQLGNHWLPFTFIITLLSLVGYALGNGHCTKNEFRQDLSRSWRAAHWLTLDASILLAISTLAISLVKPSSGARHYIVLTPTFIIALMSLWHHISNQLGGKIKITWTLSISTLIALMNLSFFNHTSYARLPDSPENSRHGNNYRTIAFIADNYNYKLTTNCTSTKMMDKALKTAGYISKKTNRYPWICVKAGVDLDSGRHIFNALNKIPAEEEFILTSGTASQSSRNFTLIQKSIESQGYTCSSLSQFAFRPGVESIAKCKKT
jgi:mannosyltransferase